LFRIALNVARDALRRRARDPVPLADAQPPAGEPPDLAFEQRELAGAVARAVAELPPTLREGIALRHDPGMRFEQMAPVLGVPASTLKSRFRVALRRLRDRLVALGVCPEES